MRPGVPQPVALGYGESPDRPGRPRPAWRRWLRATVTSATVVGVTLSLAAAAVVATTQPSTTMTLRHRFEARGRYVGAAIDGLTLAGPIDASASAGIYSAIASLEFDVLTPRHELAWDTTEPSRGSFSFDRSDPIVAFAARHGQAAHGEVISGENLPPWVADGSASDLRAMLTDHVTGVITHFRGRVTKWNVVSMPLNDDGTRRATPFQRALGDEYIAEALTAAHAADPAAKLYLSDRGIEGVNAKSQAMYDLARSLKARGVPLDGVDMESHLALGQVPATLQQNLQRFSDAGFAVTLSRLDIRIQYPADAAKLAQQAAEYARITAICLVVAGCAGMTMAGIYDDESEIAFTLPGFGSPLLFDGSFRKKPAYHGMASAFR